MLPSRGEGRRFGRKTTVDQERRSVARHEVMSTRVTTVVYVAPEVPLTSAGEKADTTQYGTAIDIWAFGVVIFQVLTRAYFMQH